MDENNNKQENKTSRHTWIGEGNETEQAVRPERRTYSQVPFETKVVERQKKKYTGFITDEELNNPEIFKMDDRKTILVSKDDIEKTLIYPPFSQAKEAPEAEAEPQPAKRKAWSVTIEDDRKFKRLIAVVAVFLVLLLFEISFVAMKVGASKMPAKTEATKAQTLELQEENKKLTEEADSYGEYDQLRELKESWERLKSKLDKSE